MSDALDLLRLEHSNIDRLLTLIERELDRFAAGERADYELLDLLLDYFRMFPDTYHHPKEDAILEKLRVRDLTAALSFETLDSEHKLMADETSRFADAIRMVESEAQVSRDSLLETGRAFVGLYRRHMAFEEEAFFPAAQQALSASDWQEIDDRLNQPDDPLFGAAAVEAFRRLRDLL